MPTLRLLPLLVPALLAVAAETAPVQLRGFGPVAAAAPADGALAERSFACASPAQAQVFMHKLARDLALSATGSARWEEPAIAGAARRVLVREGLGAFLPVVVGSEVRVFAAAEVAGLAAAAPRLAGAAGYDPAFAYPAWLDRFTTAGIGSWYPIYWGQGSDGKKLTQPNSVPDHLAYFREHGLTIQPNSGGYILRNLLPLIRAAGLGWHFCQWHEWSQDLARLAPEDLVQPSDRFSTMPHYYGQVGEGGQRLRAYRDWTFQQTMATVQDDPSLIDWLDPNGEVGPFSFFTYWDFSEANRRNLVRYLSTACGYTPEKVGQAWYGKPFASWDQVPIPMDYDVYGWRPGDPLADRAWRVHPADDKEPLAAGLAAGWQREDCDDAGWAQIQHPGAELGSLHWRVGRRTSWNRGTITVDAAWLERARAQGPVWLTMASLVPAGGWRNPDRLWINGVEAAALSKAPGHEMVAQVEVGALLRPGVNRITYLPAGAIDAGMAGPMFLTTAAFTGFPTADERLNTRNRDWREYQSWCVMERMESTFKAIRGIDPHRFIKMHAAEDKHLGIPLQARFGCYGHNTGEGGFFRPWDRRFGYHYDVPGSAEFGGGITTADGLKRWLGWYTFEGLNAFDNFHNVQEMMYSPAAPVWKEAFAYLKLAPWRDIRQPEIALLWSARAAHLVSRPAQYCFDLGRGDLQPIGYSYTYASEATIADGRLGGAQVLWDSGTWVMDPETVDGIRRWVEAGGTFVALHQTGRHTSTRRDAWPISALTGFRVKEVRPMEGTVAILHDQPLLKGLAGRNCYNRGTSIDYSGYNFADQCVALEPAAEGVQPIARYGDGAIAIGLRRLGKGRVVVLGSPFWRDSYDKTGMWWPGEQQSEFLQDILAGLGLRPLAASADRAVWREHYLANNGTEEQLALFNPTDAPRTLSVAWRTAKPLARLRDPRTGAEVAGSVDGTTVNLAPITLQPLETRIVAGQVQGAPAAAIDGWFAKTASWWRASEPGAVLPRPDLPQYTLDLAVGMNGRVYPGGAGAPEPAALSRLADPGQGFARWAGQSTEELKNRPDPARRVLLHTPLVLPAAWKAGDRIELVVSTMGYDAQVGPVAVWLDGAPVVERRSLTTPGYGDLDDGAVVDITAQVFKPGAHALVIDAGSTGFVGKVTLRRRPAVSAELAVTGTFQVQRSGTGGVGTLQLPGRLDGLYAWQDGITLPADWKGSRVFIDLDVPKPGDFDSFAINGKLVFHPVNWHRAATWMDITPWLRWDAPNRLTLVTKAATREWKPGALEIRSIRLQKVDTP
ncbi:MAG: hypothetical protein L6R48_00955 [Planctomycetes bacterium]|nr:hypothetical protein [Planctomycetota bacterium]